MKCERRCWCDRGHFTGCSCLRGAPAPWPSATISCDDVAQPGVGRLQAARAKKVGGLWAWAQVVAGQVGGFLALLT